MVQEKMEMNQIHDSFIPAGYDNDNRSVRQQGRLLGGRTKLRFASKKTAFRSIGAMLFSHFAEQAVGFHFDPSRSFLNS